MRPVAESIKEFKPLFDKTADFRYIVFYGGRAGRKSWEVANSLIIKAINNPNLLILCTREIQNSIQDSVLRLLANQIERMGVSHYFEIQKTTIRCKTSGSEFIFKGLNGLTIDSIKSLEGADICWIEEAHSVSEHSWQVLIPTIRKAGSRILITFNPDLATDPVYKRFVLNTPPKTYVFKVNYLQNPDCPQEVKDEANYLKRVDYESYAHIWLGEVREHSDAQIFKGKYKVESFDVDSSFGYPLLGADWGFAQDPNTLVKVYIKGRKLYIRSEVYRIGCEIEDTPAMFDQLQDVRSYTVRADSARPELVKYMQVKGFKIVSVDKWSGSVEDGISFMRSFEEIVIHSDCPHTAEEFRLYSYKIDKRTGDVLPDVVSLNDHCIDSIRYALQPMIRTNYVQPDYFM
jgi:phage terminase large subunit